jgi:hypothetical protein
MGMNQTEKDVVSNSEDVKNAVRNSIYSGLTLDRQTLDRLMNQLDPVYRGYQNLGAEYEGEYQGMKAPISQTGTGFKDWWAGLGTQAQNFTAEAPQAYALPKGLYTGQATDVSKRGYDQSTMQAMMKESTEAGAANQANLQRNVRKTAASQGLGAGGGMRTLRTAGETYNQQQLANQRGVNIAQGEAQRSDLQNAMAQLTGIGSLENQARQSGLQLQAGAQQGQESAYNTTVNQLTGLTGSAMGAAGTGLAGAQNANTSEQSVLNQLQQSRDQELQGLNLMIAASNPQLQSSALGRTPGFWSNFATSMGSMLGNSAGSMGK